MFDARRPKGRLFYWVLGVVVMTAGVLAARGTAAVTGSSSSPKAAKPRAAATEPSAASPIPQSGPALTSVADTVYSADGTPAQGVLLITWPAFVTASGTAVAAGVLNTTLGTNGALNVELVPNAGATPAGVYYAVVFQLGPGEVRTEYWVVPTSSPATLAQVVTMPGSGVATQPVSLQYVNTELAAKANDNTVVHLSGTETVTGIKTFSAPPNVPPPVNTGDVANKSYVDNSIANVGAGNYLPTAGGAMTGPLSLSGAPTAPLQATDKAYVDSSAAVKADLVTGLVPTSELGSGVASSLNCLLGSGAWGPCGSSANATAIQSVPVAASAPANGQVLAYSSTTGQYAPVTPSGGVNSVSDTPIASQSITQPLGTQFSANNISGIRYVTASDNWSASPTGSLAGGTQATVTLSPCPVGVDASGYSMYYVYISVQGTPEPAMVTAGTCVPGATSGTIVFTPRNSHTAGYKISSASSGIQEAVNDACGLPTAGNAVDANARIILPATGALANAIPVYGSIYAHCSRAQIEGNGTLLSCSTRNRCMVLGDLVNSNDYGAVTLRGVNFTSTVQADGCQITNTQRQSNVVTITTASACSTIQSGDIVNINFTDNTSYWGNHGPVTVSGTSITYSQTGANLSSTATPGTIAIENAAVEDNAMPGTMDDIKSSSGGGGTFNQFFVLDNDQAATIRNFDADGTQGLTCTANHCGSYVYSWGGSSGAPVISLSNLNISPQCGGNGVTVYGNNSVRISDSVIQGFGMWAVNTETILGNYGGTTLDNVYMDEGAASCPHPYEGNYFSAAGIIFEANVQGLLVRGGEQPGGNEAEFGAQNTGTVQYNYYVIANDVTKGWHSAPFLAGYALTNGTGSVTGQFPHIPGSSPGDVVTYDILRMEAELGLAPNAPSFPVKGACTGGSAAACGSIITSQAQCTGLVCAFTDSSTAANTTSYSINSLSWEPILPFWPAPVVLAGDGSQIYITPTASFDTDPGEVVAVNWNTFPELSIRACGQEPSSFGGAMEICTDGNSNTSTIVGTLLNDGLSTTGQPTGIKGRLNFESIVSNPHHIITLVDSNFAKTTATVNFRPPNDANDTYIGLDNAAAPASGAQLAFGAPVAISNYIGNKGDNASYLERLTAAGKTFNIPVTVNGNLTVTGTCAGCGGGGSGTVISGSATQLALYSASGAAVSGDSGLTDNGSTLTYSGNNGIAASAGSFSGNVTVNGQLLVAGPWTVSSPVPGTAMAAAGAGTSALGISSDGNFYISANAGTPQKVATTATSSYFSNLFQEDANDLGQFVVGETTANPQNLHVYSSYTNSSAWTRTSVGFDTADSYAVLRSESSPSGGAYGLGFWLNSGLKWVIDPTSNLKPWADEAYTIGTFNPTSGIALRPATVYAAGWPASNSGFELGKFANNSYELCNDATNGTVLNGLAVLTTAGCAVKPTSATTAGVIGVVIANPGTSGTVTLVRTGSAYCSFDAAGPTVVGDYVVASATQNPAASGFYPLCHDAGSTLPSGQQVLGRVLQATGGGTTAQMFFDMPGSSAGPSAVSSVFGRTGTVTASSGDYSVSQITGAAPLASPALTGTPTAPTAAVSTNTTQVATTAFAHGVVPPDSGATMWMPVPHASSSGTVFSTTANKAAFFGAMLGFQKTRSQVGYYVATADTSSTTYDLGIYSGTSGGSCTLVAHTGSVAGSTAMTAGAHTVNWTGGNVTLQPGRYYLALTASATSSTAVLYGDSAGVTFAGGTGTSNVGNVSVTSGGTLPGSATCPTDSVTVAALIPAWLID